MKKIVIDATNATLGRLSSYAAKQALQGREVIILNSEKAIITGKKIGIVKAYKEKRSKGGTAMRGPNFPGTAERIVRRTIRGMLPNYREGKGKEAALKLRIAPRRVQAPEPGRGRGCELWIVEGQGPGAAIEHWGSFGHSEVGGLAGPPRSAHHGPPSLGSEISIP